MITITVKLSKLYYKPAPPPQQEIKQGFFLSLSLTNMKEVVKAQTKYLFSLILFSNQNQ